MATKLKLELMELTVSDLKKLASFLPKGKASTKQEYIDLIAGHLFGPGLKQFCDALDPILQLALSEAVHHPQGKFLMSSFYAKYQGHPGWNSAAVKGWCSIRSMPDALHVFFYYSLGDMCVPDDLRALLKPLLPVPQKNALNSSENFEQADCTLRLTELEALQELPTMLRTVEQLKVQVSEKTSLPGKATLNLLAEKLTGGDLIQAEAKQKSWDQEITPCKPFAWPMLLQASGLAKRTGTTLALSTSGSKALSKPAQDVLRDIWRKWLKTTLVDEFNRVSVIKGQNAKGRVMTAIAGRRAVIEEALRACPVGRWITLNELSRFMRAEEMIFSVTHDPWKLYVCSAGYGSLGYEGSHDWNILQQRYMAVLLFEYAATLGLIDIAHCPPQKAPRDFGSMWGTDDLGFLSQYDGLQAFRINGLGAYILELTENYQAPVIESSVLLSVSPKLEIELVSGTLSAEEQLILQKWADGPANQRWQLSAEKSLDCISRGDDIGELQKFIQERCFEPPNTALLKFISQAAQNGNALKVGHQAVLVECRDAELAEQICVHKELSKLCSRAGPKTLVVRQDNLNKFQDKARTLGWGMVR